MCNLCGSIDTKLKDKYPSDNWEKKQCPRCKGDVWIYRGKSPSIKAEEMFHTGYIENSKGEGLWVGDL